jgi:ABC-type polysaccharide/polyol phosphate transport system ATPase subunit
LPTLPDGSIQVEQMWKRFRADKNIPLFYDQMKQLGKSVTRRGGPEYRWVLKDVNFSVEPGESVALIGITASGPYSA